MVNIPRNSYMALMVFFSTEEKPLGRQEMDEFWNSCSVKEKHDFMCADLTGEDEALVYSERNAMLDNRDPSKPYKQWYYGQDHMTGWCEAPPRMERLVDGSIVDGASYRNSDEYRRILNKMAEDLNIDLREPDAINRGLRPRIIDKGLEHGWLGGRAPWEIRDEIQKYQDDTETD